MVTSARACRNCPIYPSVEAIKTALDMMVDQFPQASSVDPNEVVDLSFVRQVETGGAMK